MEQFNLIKMQKKLKKYMDEMRYIHTLGVMYTAASLAMCHGADLEKTQAAGLLHDCAKCIPNQKKLKLCRQYGISVSETEERSPHLLHSKLGAFIAREKYHVNDMEILHAIEHHTTGRPAMTLIEKIIFVSDYIEPNRTKAPNLEKIRELAFSDLDFAVYIILRDTLLYLEQEKACLDNQTVVAYNYYKHLMEQEDA